MNILIINTVPTERNGITNVIFNLCQSINDNEIKMDLMAINYPAENYKISIEEKGGNVYVIPRSLSSPLKYLRDLAKIIRENEYDLVHVHGNSSTMVLDILGVLMGGCRTVITHGHSTNSSYIYLHVILKPLLNILTSCKIACGLEAGKWLYGKSRFHVLTNGVNVEKFRYNEIVREAIRKELNVSEDCILLGHIGEINENKNQSFIVDILGQLSPLGNYKLVLVGEGSERQSVERKIETLGLSNDVIFTGGINNPQDYLSAFDIMVMPSKFEGLPLTLVEAQASGLQCVISDAITKEVDLTGTMSFVSLDDGEKHWAHVIRSTKHADRINQTRDNIISITNRGYNILTSAQHLVSLYKDLTRYGSRKTHSDNNC